jgi:hypothetical protein
MAAGATMQPQYSVHGFAAIWQQVMQPQHSSGSRLAYRQAEHECSKAIVCT